ncbi:hypothetical protein CONLIGDRAFT_448553 [Coniochaeta ligniaria NRRL 30616]|uniref:Uncharacterized protein n=1 Tax=Coniochaeta ligniaria NRRL 30616 TaxID=1408157 RepID=A0A1J7IKB9_9PEZI|nr:hypothetical protein CONLIGDRAFT_448553 [Coniochaeta ligniaria NRRL 30616]
MSGEMPIGIDMELLVSQQSCSHHCAGLARPRRPLRQAAAPPKLHRANRMSKEGCEIGCLPICRRRGDGDSRNYCSSNGTIISVYICGLGMRCDRESQLPTGVFREHRLASRMHHRSSAGFSAYGLARKGYRRLRHRLSPFFRSYITHHYVIHRPP